ncbi:hypothetical protein L226DRAFT_571943 [Lentinus tigrinus ALCF2SS1-7]|nr:hypothetical protein L226DRAFT_571943 [Lentinus tigrinus ALCF2SS1-7]
MGILSPAEDMIQITPKLIIKKPHKPARETAGVQAGQGEMKGEMNEVVSLVAPSSARRKTRWSRIVPRSSTLAALIPTTTASAISTTLLYAPDNNDNGIGATPETQNEVDTATDRASPWSTAASTASRSPRLRPPPAGLYVRRRTRGPRAQQLARSWRQTRQRGRTSVVSRSRHHAPEILDPVLVARARDAAQTTRPPRARSSDELPATCLKPRRRAQHVAAMLNVSMEKEIQGRRTGVALSAPRPPLLKRDRLRLPSSPLRATPTTTTTSPIARSDAGVPQREGEEPETARVRGLALFPPRPAVFHAQHNPLASTRNPDNDERERDSSRDAGDPTRDGHARRQRRCDVSRCLRRVSLSTIAPACSCPLRAIQKASTASSTARVPPETGNENTEGGGAPALYPAVSTTAPLCSTPSSSALPATLPNYVDNVHSSPRSQQLAAPRECHDHKKRSRRRRKCVVSRSLGLVRLSWTHHLPLGSTRHPDDDDRQRDGSQRFRTRQTSRRRPETAHKRARRAGSSSSGPPPPLPRAGRARCYALGVSIAKNQLCVPHMQRDGDTVCSAGRPPGQSEVPRSRRATVGDTPQEYVPPSVPRERPLRADESFLGANGYSTRGEGPVTFPHSAEAYPLLFRDMGLSLATATLWFTNFVVAMTVPVLLGAWTPQNTLGWFAAWNVFGFVMSQLCVPETKALSLEELDQVFSVPTRTHAAKTALDKREPDCRCSRLTASSIVSTRVSFLQYTNTTMNTSSQPLTAQNVELRQSRKSASLRDLGNGGRGGNDNAPPELRAVAETRAWLEKLCTRCNIEYPKSKSIGRVE